MWKTEGTFGGAAAPEGGREERKDEGIPPMSRTVQQLQSLMKGRELQDHLPRESLKKESPTLIQR